MDFDPLLADYNEASSNIIINFPLKRICQHHSGIASKKAKSATFSDIQA